ncbi:hypothetical protein PSPO01_01816 [Paraphaeosphaeria sporulosa]
MQQAISGNDPEWSPVEVELLAKFRSIFPGWNPHEPKLTWIDPKIANMVARQMKVDDGNDWEVFLIDWSSIKSRVRPSESYKRPKIQQMMMKDLDLKPDRERLAVIKDDDWNVF